MSHFSSSIIAVDTIFSAAEYHCRQLSLAHDNYVTFFNAARMEAGDIMIHIEYLFH